MNYLESGMLREKNFVVLEGMCQSGKTSLAKRLEAELAQAGQTVFYNHGALTYTETGQAFAKNIDQMSIAFSTSFYLADLVQNTQRGILPRLHENQIIIQDRYVNSILTYRRAYSALTGEYLDTQPVVDLYLTLGLLIQPGLELFCLPPVEIIRERLNKARQTSVHDFYLENPKFIDLVYNQIKHMADQSPQAICVNTNDPANVEAAITHVKRLLL